jgi:hypothetical protein
LDKPCQAAFAVKPARISIGRLLIILPVSGIQQIVSSKVRTLKLKWQLNSRAAILIFQYFGSIIFPKLVFLPNKLNIELL